MGLKFLMERSIKMVLYIALSRGISVVSVKSYIDSLQIDHDQSHTIIMPGARTRYLCTNYKLEV